MQVPRTETMAVKAVTLRSAQSPQRMAAAVAVLGAVLPSPAQAEEEAVSGQKGRQAAPWQLTARAEVAMVLHRQA